MQDRIINVTANEATMVQGNVEILLSSHADGQEHYPCTAPQSSQFGSIVLKRSVGLEAGGTTGVDGEF